MTTQVSHVTGSACVRMSKTRRKAEPTESPTHNTVTDEESEDESDAYQEPESANHHTDSSSLSLEEMIRLQNTGRKSQRSRPRKVGVEPRKSGPMEISSKRPAPFLRKVTNAKTPMRRDPRFDDLSGEYKPEVFAKTFKFLEEMKTKEKEIVQKKLRKSRDPEMKDKLQKLLHRMDQQEEAEQRRLKLRERELDYKRRLREDARQGKKPFYLKKGDIRKLELADKYRELQRKGKLDHFLSKKRKRNSHKDRRRLPNQ